MKVLKTFGLILLLIAWYFLAWGFGVTLQGYLLNLGTAFIVVIAICFLSIFYVPRLLFKWLYPYKSASVTSKYISWIIFGLIILMYYSIHFSEGKPFDSSYIAGYLFHLLMGVAFSLIKDNSSITKKQLN